MLIDPVLLILPVLLIFCEVRILPKSSLPTFRFVIHAEFAPKLIVLIKPAAKLFVLIFTELIVPAIIWPVLKRFVLIFAVVTPPAGENPPDKFNEMNVAVPAFTVAVLIFALLLIFCEVNKLPKSSLPTYKFVT